MANLLLLNKPFRVLSQFTSDDNKRTLAEYVHLKGYYPAGRLDWDSEGLLLLTDNGALQARIAHPDFHLVKTYWVQVEGIPDQQALDALREGVRLKEGVTRPASAKLIAPPALWPRQPPVRHRKTVSDSWIELKISEGKNRQVRRMTAAVGHPTLRLVRYAIGDWTVDGLAPGQSQLIHVNLPATSQRKPGMRRTPPPGKRKR